MENGFMRFWRRVGATEWVCALGVSVCILAAVCVVVLL